MANNPLIELLAAYGPSPAASNMYDEHVMKAADKFGVPPLEVKQPLIEELCARLRDEPTVNIILTGTAGDGKTYVARRVYEQLIGPAESRWRATDKLIELDLDGRRLVFVKDLSALTVADKALLAPGFARALAAGEDTGVTYLVCSNDGHLLKYWRDLIATPPADDAYRTIYDCLRHMLRDERCSDPALRLHLRNMSRSTHDALFEALIDTIIDHPMWSACAGCSSAGDAEHPCPIHVNRDRLRKDTPLSMRRRLVDLIRLAAANDMHLPIRQLILLVVNILLGDAHRSNRGLLTCNRARKRAKNNDYMLVNPFDNAFGLNLRPNDRASHRAFAIMDAFGVGFETTNPVDNHLLDPRSHPAPSRVVDDPVFGHAGFEAIRHRYLAEDLDDVDMLHRAMEAQRRRLFFTLPDPRDSDDGFDPWQLTIYRYGGRYLRLQARLGKPGRPFEIEHDEPKIARGLNRAFTGLMAEDTDKVYLAISATGGQAGLGRVIDTEPLRADIDDDLPYLGLLPTGPQGRAQLVILHRGEPRARVDLRPLLYEYLLRVADGALASSFSRQCYEELRQFRLRALAQLRRKTDKAPFRRLQLLRLNDQDGTIKSTPLTIRLEDPSR